MTGDPETTRILRPSPLRCVGLASACFIMAVILFYLWFKGTENAWVAGSFMAAGAVFFFVHLVPDAYALRLDSRGFKTSEMFSVKRFDWSEVSEFTVRRGLLGHYVEFHQSAPETGTPQRVVLNETYGFKPVEMARLLNDHRKQAAAEKKNPVRRNVWRSRDC
jgi:hypothetical protein